MDVRSRIESWIRQRQTASQQAAAGGDQRAKALGFIMTVYRRRLTSSFAAIELSLTRRRVALAATRDELTELDDFLAALATRPI